MLGQLFIEDVSFHSSCRLRFQFNVLCCLLGISCGMFYVIIQKLNPGLMRIFFGTISILGNYTQKKSKLGKKTFFRNILVLIQKISKGRFFLIKLCRLTLHYVFLYVWSSLQTTQRSSVSDSAPAASSRQKRKAPRIKLVAYPSCANHQIPM